MVAANQTPHSGYNYYASIQGNSPGTLIPSENGIGGGLRNTEMIGDISDLNSR